MVQIPQTVWCRVVTIEKWFSKMTYLLLHLPTLPSKCQDAISAFVNVINVFSLSTVCLQTTSKPNAHLCAQRKLLKWTKIKTKIINNTKYMGGVNVCKLQHCCTLSDRKWWWLSAAAVCSHRVQQLQLDSDTDTDPAGLDFTLGCGILHFYTSSESSSS